jgi:hypothetical protein
VRTGDLVLYKNRICLVRKGYDGRFASLCEYDKNLVFDKKELKLISERKRYDS